VSGGRFFKQRSFKLDFSRVVHPSGELMMVGLRKDEARRPVGRFHDCPGRQTHEFALAGLCLKKREIPRKIGDRFRGGGHGKGKRQSPRQL
jgi:hypothetical protein